MKSVVQILGGPNECDSWALVVSNGIKSGAAKLSFFWETLECGC